MAKTNEEQKQGVLSVATPIAKPTATANMERTQRIREAQRQIALNDKKYSLEGMLQANQARRNENSLKALQNNTTGNPYASQVYQYGAQIAMYGDNQQRRQNYQTAYTNYMQSLSNPYSRYYNPYIQPTNYKAIEGLKQYGYDPEQMTDDQLRMLTAGKRLTDTGYTAAAPTKGSTPAQDIGYYAQEYLQAQDTTLKAEKELDDLGKDIEYYVSKGYSDKQIYDAVSSKYSTLNSMMSKKAEGNAVLLNRAVNFNGDDTIYGMIWSARNGGSVGDYGLDAAAYYSKIGNTYKPDEAYTRRHDATNKDTYNPYADGTTLNLGDKYRVINFSREWLQEHRLELDEDDILKIDDAITNSEKAEAEIAQLNEYIAKQLEGKTPQQQVEIYKKLADRMSDDKNDWLNEQGYATLSKMESKRTSGNPLALGYGIDFNLKDTINDLRAKGEAINGEIKTEEAQTYVDNQKAKISKKYKNNDEEYLKALEGMISDVRNDEKYAGADIDSVVADLEREADTIRVKLDRSEKQKAREAWEASEMKRKVEEVRASGKTISERMATGQYSEAQLLDKAAKYMRGDNIGEDWEAMMGATFRSLLFATENVDYGHADNAIDAGYGLIRRASEGIRALTKLDEVDESNLADIILRTTGISNVAAQGLQSLWRTALGKEGYDALARAKQAYDDGIISSDQYVQYVYDMSVALEDSADLGIPFDQYLTDPFYKAYIANESFDYLRLDPVIEAQREERAAEYAEAEQQAKAAVAEMINTAETNVANGTATEQDIATVRKYREMDLNTVFESSNSLKMAYHFQKQDISEMVQEDMYWKLKQAFGEEQMKQWQQTSSSSAISHLLQSNADQIAELAMEYYEDDYKKAAACGMTLDEYYDMFPALRPSEERKAEIIAAATNQYNKYWGQVWTDIENTIAGTATSEETGLEDVWDASTLIGDARDLFNYQRHGSQDENNSPQPLPQKTEEEPQATEEPKENKKNNIPVWEAAYIGGDIGWTSYKYGATHAFSKYITYMADEELEAYNRATYMNDPVAYREDLIKSVQGLADPELAKFYTQMLKEYDGDVFNITMNFLDQDVQNVMYKMMEHQAERRQYVEDNASPAMAAFINEEANLVHNSLLMGTVAGLTALGVEPTVATTLVYGLPESAEMMDKWEEAGIDHNASRALAIFEAGAIGLIEKFTTYDMFIKNAGGKAFNAIVSRRGIAEMAKNMSPKSLFGKIGMGILKGVGKAVAVTGPAESLQEGTEAAWNIAFGSTVEMLGNLKYDGAGLSFDRNWRDTLDKWIADANIPEAMKEGYIAGIGLDAIANLGGAAAGFVSDIAHSKFLRRSRAGRTTTTTEAQTDAEIMEEAKAEAEAVMPESQKMAVAMSEGTIEPTIENIMTLLDKYAEDLSDPRVRKLFEDQAAMTEAQETLASEILNGPDNSYTEGLKQYKDALSEAQKEVEDLNAKLEQERKTIEENGKKLEELQAFVQADPANKEKAQRYTDYLAESRQVIEQHDATLEQYGKAQQAAETAQRDYDTASIAYVDGAYQAARQTVIRKRKTIAQMDAVASQLEAEADALYQKTVTKATDALKAAQVALKEAKRAPVERAQAEKNIRRAENNIKRAEKKVEMALESPQLALAQARADYARLTANQMSAHHISLGDAAAYVQERNRLRSLISELEGVVRNRRVGNVATESDWSILAGVTMMAQNPRGSAMYVRGQNLAAMAAATNRFRNLPADATYEQISQAKAKMDEAINRYKEGVRNGDKVTEEEQKAVAEAEATVNGQAEAEVQTEAEGQAETAENVGEQTKGETEQQTETAEQEKAAPQNTEEKQYYHGTKTTQDLYVQDGKNKVKVESPQTVIRKLSKEIKVPTYIAGNKKLLPVYNKVAKLVLKNVAMVNDLAAGLHEIGHFIQDKTGFKPEMTSGLQDLMNELQGTVDYDFGSMEDEAFAELFTVYMASRDRAVEIAGEANVRNFEQALRDNKMFKPISQAAVKVANYLNADADEQLSSRIVNRSDTVKRGRLYKILNSNESVAIRSDHSYAARDFDRKVKAGGYNLQRAMQYMIWGKRGAQRILNDEQITPYHKIVDVGLHEFFETHGINADNINEFYLLRMALYSKERAAQDKGFLGNFSEDRVQQIIDKYGPEFAEANDAFSKWWQKFTHNWLVDTGPVTEEEWADWNKKYPNYIPTFRELNGALVDVDYDKSNGQARGGWTFHEAKESDLNIISPLDTIPEQIQAIVTRVSQLEVAQKFDEMYQANKQYGLGEFAREITTEMAEGENSIETIMNPRPRGQQRDGVLTVQRRDGTKVTYDFTGGNMLLYRAITTAGPEAAPAIIRAVGSMGRIVAQTTTALSPIFAGSNAMRDQPQSFEQGTYTKSGTYLEGIPRWYASLARVARTKIGDVPGLGTVLEKTGALDKIKPSEVVQEFERMGGGEWSMTDTTRVRNREEIRRGYIPGYKGANTAHKIGYYSDKTFHVLTGQEFNGMVEEASRVAEYGSPEYDRTTEEGRRLAFLMSQENTVNFGKFGLGKGFSIFKSLVLFGNPTLQGLEQARDTLFTAFDESAPEEDRKRAWTIIGKRALNMGMLAGLQTAVRHLFFNDEDKEHYDQLAQDYKIMNFIFPTRWLKELTSFFGANFPAMEGERRWVRMPIGQSVIDQALYSGFTAAMNNLDGIDSTSINFLDAAGKLLHDNLPIDPFQFGGWDEWLNGLASSTVFGIPVAVATNRTWANSYIVPGYMKDDYVTEQYYEDTPMMFRYMSRALTTAGIKISPIALQYIFEQYSGYFGSILIPAMSPDQGTGELTPWRNITNSMKRRFTIDDLTSNDIMNTYYDMIDKVSVMADWENKGYLPVFMDQSQDPEDAKKAAEAFEKSIKGLQKQLKEVNATIKEIGADENLTPAERAIQKKEYQQERLNIMMEINEMGGDWMRQWGSKSVLAKIIGY